VSADQDPGTDPERPQTAGGRQAPDRSAGHEEDPAGRPEHLPGTAGGPAGTGGPGAEGPVPGTADVDRAFAELVSHLSDPVAGGVGPWPVSEDADGQEPGPGPDRAERDADGAGPRPGTAGGPERPGEQDRPEPPVMPALPYSLLDLPGAGPDDDEPVEEFVPPDPPPLPRGDRTTRLAWYGVLGGPAFLLLCAMFWKDLPTGIMLAAIGAFLAGFVALVARLPSERPDDPDDGAVV